MFDIKGLFYRPNYISADQQKLLLQTIDEQAWRGDLSRRTQHYGYVYDYKARKVDPQMYLGPLPTWLLAWGQNLQRDGVMPEVPDQAIINEYEAGQGIADHIDCVPCFGDVVVSLSLGSTCIMELKNGRQKHALLLEPGSLIILRDEARFDWTHGIPKRKQDILDGQAFPRERRVSVTFRTIILER